MKKILLAVSVSAGLVSVPAQQFRIGDYDGESVTIEYPPSFDGAYLFIEQSSNLTDQAWEWNGENLLKKK